jgi:hypothetical protein
VKSYDDDDNDKRMQIRRSLTYVLIYFQYQCDGHRLKFGSSAMKNRPLCHYADITLGCGDYVYRVQNYFTNHFIQATRVTNMQSAVSSKYKGGLLYLRNKRRQTYFKCIFFFVSQYFYTPNVVLRLHITNNLLNIIFHYNSDN